MYVVYLDVLAIINFFYSPNYRLPVNLSAKSAVAVWVFSLCVCLSVCLDDVYVAGIPE